MLVKAVVTFIVVAVLSLKVKLLKTGGTALLRAFTSSSNFFILLVKLSNTARRSQIFTALATLSVQECSAVAGLGIEVFEGTVTLSAK